MGKQSSAGPQVRVSTSKRLDQIPKTSQVEISKEEIKERQEVILYTTGWLFVLLPCQCQCHQRGTSATGTRWAGTDRPTDVRLRRGDGSHIFLHAGPWAFRSRGGGCGLPAAGARPLRTRHASLPLTCRTRRALRARRESTRPGCSCSAADKYGRAPRR